MKKEIRVGILLFLSFINFYGAFSYGASPYGSEPTASEFEAFAPSLFPPSTSVQEEEIVEEPVEFMEEEEVVLGAPAAPQTPLQPLVPLKPAPSDQLLLLQSRAQEMGDALKNELANVGSLTSEQLKDKLLQIKAMGTALTMIAEQEAYMDMVREDLQVLRDSALVLQSQRQLRAPAPAVVRAPVAPTVRDPRSHYEKFGPHGGGWAPRGRRRGR